MSATEPLTSGQDTSTMRASPSPWARGQPNRLRAISIVTVLAFIGGWELASTYLIDPFFLPPPTEVMGGMWELLRDGTLVGHITSSLKRILVGWLLGSAIAVPLGLVAGRSRVGKAIIDPFLHFFRFVPAISLITIFIVWFGTGEVSKIALVLYAASFTVMVNTATGVAAIPADKIHAARVLGASEAQVFRWIIMPASVPYIFLGMRLALATSFLVIVAAEIVAADSGLGFLIWNSRLYFAIDWLFAGIVTIGVLGFVSDRAWVWFGRRQLGKYMTEAGTY